MKLAEPQTIAAFDSMLEAVSGSAFSLQARHFIGCFVRITEAVGEFNFVSTAGRAGVRQRLSVSSVAHLSVHVKGGNCLP